jgi:hypothetical protein
MSKINRNSPCPCGSGRKYKACCIGSGTVSNIQSSQFWRIHERIVPRLLECATEAAGADSIHDAWIDFNGDENVEPHDSTHPINLLFAPWFLFSWHFETTLRGEGPFVAGIVDLFALSNLERLTFDEKEYVLSVMGCPYSFCEVVATRPGSTLTLKDLLRGVQFSVEERTLSGTIERGEILYCATADFRGARFNIGTGPYTLRPTSKRAILELRDWITNEIGGDTITAKDLFEFDDDIRFLYLDLMESRLAPPTILNTDGDPMLPHTLYFEIASSDGAFHALKELAEGASPDDLLHDAVVREGIVKKVDIPWLGGTDKGRKQLGGPVILGLLKIDDTQLVVEVNSKNRADRVRKIIEERLGDRVVYRRAKIESLESQLSEMSPTSSKQPAITKSEILGKAPGTSLSPDDPRIRAALEEHARKHWESWFDIAIPALGDITPREAAKSDKGRVLLESLLQEYENNSVEGDLFHPDIPHLKRELGMK